MWCMCTRLWRAHIIGVWLVCLAITVTLGGAYTDELNPRTGRPHNVIVVGGLGIGGEDLFYEAWNATFSTYLTNHVDPALNLTFRLVYLNFNTTYKFAEQKKIDLVYTNPSIFACLENEFGASPVASLRNLLRVGDTTLEVQEFFGTFIVRSKSSIYNISEIVGKTVEAESLVGLGAAQLQWHELQQRGISFLNAPKQVRFSNSQKKIIEDVLSGEADIGMIRTDLYERFVADGVFPAGGVRVLEDRRALDPTNAFPFPFSTRLAAPEWAIASLPHVPWDIARAVSEGLYSITPEDDAAKAANYATWTAPQSYQGIHQMQRTLALVDENFKCIRSDNLCQTTVCPAGFVKKSCEEIANGCKVKGLPCPEGYECLCEPCRKIVDTHTEEVHNVSMIFRALLIVVTVCALFFAFTIYWRFAHNKRLQMKLLSLREREVLDQDLQELLEACIEGPSASGEHSRGSWQSIVSSGGSAGDSEVVGQLSQMIFVFTDIQDSTAMSAFDPVAMKSVQNVHDVVIRHHIALNNGYEMNTQGDSFEIAFGNVQSATRFCLAVQLDLLHANWSKNVLLLPSCGVVKNASGKLVFAGPRVRMGIHLATKGTFAFFWHDLTKQVQFDGPAVKLAAMIGDSAVGGQIVMSETTLYSNEGAVTKLAVLQLLGKFLFEVPPNDPVLVAVFNVLPLALAKMPARDFSKPLRRCLMVEKGEGMQLVPPPLPMDDHGLAVVIITMEDLVAMDQQLIEEHTVNNITMLHVASFVQQFQGYKLLQTDSRQLVYMFQKPMQAVHFGMILQVALMAASWDERMTLADLRIERNQQGKIIYRGPRVGVLVHSSHDIAVNILHTPPRNKKRTSEEVHHDKGSRGQSSESSVSRRGSRALPGLYRSSQNSPSSNDIERGISDEAGPIEQSKGSWTKRIWEKAKGSSLPSNLIKEPLLTRSSKHAYYSGHGLRDAEVLSALVHPGQMVVTEAVWKAVQGSLPALAQVISLGVHEVRDMSDTRPQTLTELSASCITQRTIPKVVAHKCLVPGYRRAPEVHEDLTCMFCNVMSCPAVPVGIDQEVFTQAYDTSVMLWSELVRRLLTQFDGYECKEPERGKFMLVFKFLKNAVGFAVTIQSALMDMDYPPVLLKADECTDVRMEADGALLYRGLRVKIGMAHGRASLKKPVRSTGRADYDGMLCNTAARLMSVAPPGQIFTDGTNLHELLNREIPQASALLKKERKRLLSQMMRTHAHGSMSSFFSASSTSIPALTVKDSFHSVESVSTLHWPDNSGGEDKKALRFDQSASQFELKLSPFSTEAGPVVGPLIAKGYGVYTLKGVPEAIPLVQLSLLSLTGRKKLPDAQRA